MTAQQSMQRGQQDATRDLIREEGILITLLRSFSTWTTSASGGQVQSVVATSQQPVMRFFGGQHFNETVQTNTPGELATGEHVLVGLWNDDIRMLDEFVVGSRRFRVIYVHGDRRFECRARAQEIGSI